MVKWRSILLAVTIFTVLGGLTTVALGRPPLFGVVNAILIGVGVGSFEEFYVQSGRGRWLRRTHALKSFAVYVLAVVILSVAGLSTTHILLGSVADLPGVYRRLPTIIPVFLGFSIAGVVAMRAAHFIGVDTLFHLVAGTYHRPVLERKVILFLDMNDSTFLAERLGPFQTRSLVTRFLMDVSAPIVDRGGEIYLYKGDGLVATWSWAAAVRGNAVLRAVDAMVAAVEGGRTDYQRTFGVVPSFRIGIHGGNVVVSEIGDAKRAIGIYGNAINIAARMEEAAKAHQVRCAISEDICRAMTGEGARMRLIGLEPVKGLSTPVNVFEYQATRVGSAASW